MAQPAPTLADALEAIEAQLFVGRTNELHTFQSWLAIERDTPALLDISGHGGVGKTALLRAFARLARQQARPVVYADSRAIASSPASFLQALSSALDPLADLNARRPLLLLDTTEELGPLYRYLEEEFLPSLAGGIHVVFAGRYPMAEAWTEGSTWRQAIQSLPLEGFGPAERDDYLQRRGLDDPALRAQVGEAAGTNPLALALAADLVSQLGVRDLAAAPEWHLVVRTLVERLLRELNDSTLRELLDACAVVRQFDEPTLAALVEAADIRAAFDRLCQLSGVRAAEHGLMLHDDLRRVLADELRWRNPERHRELRRRAMRYYEERARTAPLEEQEWLTVERLFLCGDVVVQAILFGDDEPDQAWLEPGRPEHHAVCEQIWLGFWQQVLPAELLPNFEAQRGWMSARLRDLLQCPGLRLRIVRERTGQVVGFSAFLPVSQESLPLLLAESDIRPAIEGYFGSAGLAALPDRAADSRIFVIACSAWTSTASPAAAAALSRDNTTAGAQSGIFLAATFLPPWQMMLESFGYEPMKDTTVSYWPGAPPATVYAIDLIRVDTSDWLNALIRGRRPPRAFTLEELERELHAVLRVWSDDAALAASPLLRSAPVVAALAEPGPASLREAILQAFRRGHAQASTDQAQSYLALELLYLDRAASPEQVASTLGVSRATIFRLLNRGVRDLAAAFITS